jgi:serine/threonine protein kinase
VAPEVYKHMDYTESVDVYSYAMILFYLLDGRPPWPYDNGLVAVKKAAEEGERPPVPRHWDERLQNLLQEAWHETPSHRPPFRSILKTLNEYARKSIFWGLCTHCQELSVSCAASPHVFRLPHIQATSSVRIQIT